jgi:hypothetical protein
VFRSAEGGTSSAVASRRAEWKPTWVATSELGIEATAREVGAQAAAQALPLGQQGAGLGVECVVPEGAIVTETRLGQ